VRVTGCLPELLHAIAEATAVRPLHDADQAPAAGIVGAAPFLRSVVELGEAACGFRVGSPEHGAALTAGDAGSGIDRLVGLWSALNRGQTLLLEPGPATDRPPPSSPDDELLWSAATLDRLPPLREERGPEIRDVPTYLVLVDVEGVPPEAACEALRRLLAEVRDARFHARGLSRETGAWLQATLGSDPRYLPPDATIPAGIPYVVHASVGVPLTTAVLDALVGWNHRADVSVVRVVRPGEDDGQHLSLSRTASLLRHVPRDLDGLRLEPGVLHALTDVRTAESAGLDWVLPERVELARGHVPAADVLGATAATSTAELAAIARLQQRLVRERRARERLKAELETQKTARRRAEAQLDRRVVRVALRVAQRVGRLRVGLRG
jgi:hypothetical protein